MRVKNALFLIALSLALLPAATGFAAQDPIQKTAPVAEVPQEVQALVGSYAGSWTTMGLGPNGEITDLASWTDTMIASHPTTDGKRAWVKTVDQMVFEGGHIPPFELPGIEGFHLNDDGSLGSYFIETAGLTFNMMKLSKNTWCYAAQASPQELMQMGFPHGATGDHALIKVILDENGVETHRIHRVSTVSWPTDSGLRTLQFVSLRGIHRRM